MLEFNNKQKIIFAVCILFVIFIIGYYIFDISNSENYEEVEYVENNISQISEKEEDEEELEVVVHITGAVNNTGIIVAKEGNRIADIIELAGGAKAEAATDSVNLAYKVEDGQKIYIPYKDEINENLKDNQEEYIVENNHEEVYIKEKNSNSVGNSMVNINTATSEQLQSLSGIGASTAEKIIKYRNENGKFSNIEEIKNVNGIGEAKFNNIKDSICTK